MFKTRHNTLQLYHQFAGILSYIRTNINLIQNDETCRMDACRFRPLFPKIMELPSDTCRHRHTNVSI